MALFWKVSIEAEVVEEMQCVTEDESHTTAEVSQLKLARIHFKPEAKHGQLMQVGLAIRH